LCGAGGIAGRLHASGGQRRRHVSPATLGTHRLGLHGGQGELTQAQTGVALRRWLRRGAIALSVLAVLIAAAGVALWRLDKLYPLPPDTLSLSGEVLDRSGE